MEKVESVDNRCDGGQLSQAVCNQISVHSSLPPPSTRLARPGARLKPRLHSPTPPPIANGDEEPKRWGRC